VTKEPLQIARPKEAARATPQAVASINPFESFKNRFDNPITERELDQLRLAKLKGTDQKLTQELLNSLFNQSKQLAQQLSASPKLSPAPKATLKASPSSPRPPSPKVAMVETRKDKLTQDLLDAQEDARYLIEDYSKQSLQEQQEGLGKLRTKYAAGVKANSVHIQKLIREKLASLRDEIQTL
jgi:hypothetical protein